MADSVKINIMKQIGTLIYNNVADLKSVRRWKGKPVDLDVTPLPALFFYDEDETRQRRNLLQTGLMSLYLVVFFNLPLDVDDISGAQDFGDQADDIQAQIHNLFFGTNNLQSMGVLNVEEIAFHKEYPNDIHGLLVMQFRLTYAHKFGDAYSTLQ